MKESTKAYTAGLFDAEGCVGLYLWTHKTNMREQYQARVVIANIHFPVIKWLVATFGGGFTKYTPEKGRTWYQWRIGEGASKFLSDLLPYLRVKKKEAELLLKYFEIQDTQDKETFGKIAEELRLLKDRECSTTDTLDSPDIEDKLTHAYLAGFFDGEGCISVAMASTINKLVLHINMANSYFPMIDIFKKVYSGWHQTRPPKGNTKQSYRWWVTKQDLQENFLLKVLPYLIIKRKQAKLALRYVHLSQDYIKKEKMNIRQQIQELNGLKIQPDLLSNAQSGPTEMLEA